jgi:hypothetical protein
MCVGWDDGGNLTNVQCQAIGNWQNEFHMYMYANKNDKMKKIHDKTIKQGLFGNASKWQRESERSGWQEG